MLVVSLLSSFFVNEAKWDGDIPSQTFFFVPSAYVLTLHIVVSIVPQLKHPPGILSPFFGAVGVGVPSRPDSDFTSFSFPFTEVVGIDLSKASKDGLFTRSLAREGDIFPSACNRSRSARL